MKKFSGRTAAIIIWAVVWVFFMFGSGIVEKVVNPEVERKEDLNMTTQYFNTDIEVGENQSYKVTEQIGVDFLTPRHGIYRYIPVKGTVYTKDGGNFQVVPYNARLTGLESREETEVDSESGSKVIRFGSEDAYLTGRKEYRFSYTVTPRFQENAYQNAYYNVFPTQWQNRIPAGSRFTITFPKEFPHDILEFYYGTYGENKNAAAILDLSWQGNTVTGILKKDLKLGEGITFFAPMEAGYFTGVGQLTFLPWLLLLPAVILLLLIVFLFVRFGRDEPIIPSIQYQPPDNLDSAAVGYIIDGSVEDKDLLSLIIYWADKGFLSIKEMPDHGLSLFKLKELPEEAPSYQFCIFNKLFEYREIRKISDLQYKFSGTLEMAKKQLKNYFQKQGRDMIYTRESKIARTAAIVCCTLPLAWFMVLTSIYSYTSGGRIFVQVLLWVMLLVGTLVFCSDIDTWYARTDTSRRLTAGGTLAVCFLSTAVYAGSYVMRVFQYEVFNYIWVLVPVLAATGVMIGLAGFMKRRTSQCIEWMGRLAGLRDFIETAELERMNELAKTNPEWFYHIIPYAYVFGLSDVFAKKLKGLSVPAPEWFSPYHSYSFFDYYMFNRLMMSSLNKTASTLTVSKPVQSGGSGGSFGGGGFGGGGFSGGGFGGGGGGSW
ncbi:MULTISPECIES: DUF2207 domain-containing protein [unclassified Eubacterium (in: firmicutes)]|uniref:DUF2207 family protein n=1 Tax=unclassified Eubacterium (in: firmicutes) TaxID=2624479 RepID=UPI001FAB01A4|nr:MULTISPECIES: DUF2207 domain-containing protein [unclassified Eubacterium (in: firmicutes)]